MPPELLAAMHAASLQPSHDLAPLEGVLVRFHVEGDKRGSRNGWAVVYRHPLPAAAFGSWRTGATHTWRATLQRPETAAERAERGRQVQRMRALRAAELAAVQTSARTRAASLFNRAKPATDAHAYLVAKRVHAFGLRQLRQALVIPARDAAGELHTLQFIQPDGRKTFLTGGRVRGCYFSIGRPGARLLLAEGYATAATLYMATGAAVACCFNAGNLLPVAQALRAKFPALQMVIVADNDSHTAGNPGVTKAREAARAVRALLAVPQFKGIAE